MSDLQSHGVHSLSNLENKIDEFARKQQTVFPKCKLERLGVIAHSNMLHEWYNLLYNDKKSMISIFARPDSTESAFRDFDGAK